MEPEYSRALRPIVLYKAIGLLFLLLILYRFFDLFAHVLLLLYASAVIAVTIEPFARRVQVHRSISAAVVGIVIFAVIGVTLWLSANLIISELRGLIAVFPAIDRELLAWEQQLRDRTGLDIYIFGDTPLYNIVNTLAEFASANILPQLPGMVSAVFITFVIILGGLFSLAQPDEGLLMPLKRLFPKERRAHVERVFALLSVRIRSFIRARLILMVTSGVLTYIALKILGVPHALPLSIFSGIASFLPLIGSPIGAIPAILVALIVDPMKALWTLIAFIIIDQTQGNLLQPWIMNMEAKVHPVVTLFSIILFGGMFGLLGIILAIPIAILIGTIIQVLWVETAIRSHEDHIRRSVR